MAPKLPNPKQVPPSASSSSEEEDDERASDEGNEEEEDGGASSEEEDDNEEPQAHPQKPSASKPRPQVQPKKPESEDSESGSDSESDSDFESDRPNHAALDRTVKPIASKPMEKVPSKISKPGSKPSATVAASASNSAVAKRGNEIDRGRNDTKRRKMNESEDKDGVVEKSEDAKKQLFQRLWSEDDEIALLKGVIDFTEEKGVDPTKDMGSFYGFVKKSLHVDVSLAQVKDKVSRLRKKFENHVKGKRGEDKRFSNPHEQKSFDLSKKIWGSEGPGGATDSAVKLNRRGGNGAINSQRGNSSKLAALKAELGMEDEEDKMEVDREKKGNSSYRGLGIAVMEDFVMKKGLDVVEGSERAELEKRWRKLRVAELELFLQRNDLVRDQAVLVMEAYKIVVED